MNSSDDVYYENKCVWQYEFYNMSCDSNDHELKLTKEYKYLLSYIRPLIDQLDKSRDAQLCLLWLSKLEQCASWERNYRNKILTELCRQVKSNCLKPPFNASPPSGPLRSIVWGDWNTRDWINNECSEMYASTEEVVSSSSHQSFNSLRNLQKRQVCPGLWKGGFCNSMKSRTTKPVKEMLDHSECFAIQKAYHERAQSDQTVIERYQDIIKSLVSQQLKADISPNKLKKLQSTYEVKLSELMQSLQKEQEENEVLKRKIKCFEEDLSNLDALKNDNENLQKKISQKKTVNEVNEQNEEMQMKEKLIFELEKEKASLEGKCKEADEEKLLSLSDLISKLNETEKKLKDSEKRYKSLERKYEECCRNFESEYEARADEKEKLNMAKITSLEKLIEEKQTEINGLKEQLNSQSFHFGQEISRLKQQLEENPNFGKDKEKIKNLKNKTKKLEKMREHMAVLFQSQLQQILAKKDFYIASLEMQLKMNNSESGGNALNSDFHNTLDQKISNLEAQYRKLLEDSEQQSIQRRQLDLQKIHTLEKQLLSFGGVVVDNESDLDPLKTNFLTSDSTFDVNSNASKRAQ